MDPDVIDLIGEDLPTALERLDQALSKVSEKKKSNILLTLFGEKGESAANVLLDQREKIRERIALQTGGAFEPNVSIFRRSEFAARRPGFPDREARQLTSVHSHS